MPLHAVEQNVFNYIMCPMLGYKDLVALLYVSKSVSKKIDKSYLQSRKWWTYDTFDVYSRPKHACRFTDVAPYEIYDIMKYAAAPTYIEFTKHFMNDQDSFRELSKCGTLIELRLPHTYKLNVIIDIPPNLQTLTCYFDWDLLLHCPSALKLLPRSLKTINIYNHLSTHTDIIEFIIHCPHVEIIHLRCETNSKLLVTIHFTELKSNMLFNNISYKHYATSIQYPRSPQELFKLLPHAHCTDIEMTQNIEFYACKTFKHTNNI